jgi:competence transcription factor ComK
MLKFQSNQEPRRVQLINSLIETPLSRLVFNRQTGNLWIYVTYINSIALDNSNEKINFINPNRYLANFITISHRALK